MSEFKELQLPKSIFIDKQEFFRCITNIENLRAMAKQGQEHLNDFLLELIVWARAKMKLMPFLDCYGNTSQISLAIELLNKSFLPAQKFVQRFFPRGHSKQSYLYSNFLAKGVCTCAIVCISIWIRSAFQDDACRYWEDKILATDIVIGAIGNVFS